MKIVADENIPFVSECFGSFGRVISRPANQITPELVKDADVLLVRSVTKVGADLLAGSSVRFVGTATIGFEHIDTGWLAENSISFASAPGSNADSVAQYVIAALLNLAHKYKFHLQEKSIGIIGVGNVGRRVEKMCSSLGMKVLLNDPPLRRQNGDAKYLPLEELFGCDIITFHTPLTFEGIDKTFHLVDEKFFDSLKVGCIFINTSRGGVVDTSALKNALSAGLIKSAVLDVWENEPNIDTELLQMVDIATPHIAGYSLDGKIAGMIMIYKAACKYFGIEVKNAIRDFLPEPEVPRLKINAENSDEQEVLSQAVEKIYKITGDDSRLRQILDMPAEERGKYFTDLRKNYPVRREFQNTKIEFATAPMHRDASKDTEKLKKSLIGIGFKL